MSPSGSSTVPRERLAGPRRPLPGAPGGGGGSGGAGGPGDSGGDGHEHGGLQRVLGVPALFAAAYGNVGSSIYYALGLVAGYALGLTPVAFAVSGIIFLFTAMTYAEATTKYPEAGGASSFARHAFNEFTSFVTAWAQMLNYVITMAISAYFVPHYLKIFWEPLGSDVGSAIGGIVVIIALAALNIVGVQETAALTVGLAVADFGTQVLLALLGMFLLLSPSVLVSNVHLGIAPTWSDFLLGISVSMIAYTGIETISNLAEETRDPVRSVPRAIGWVVAAVLGLYLILPVVALSALPVIFPKNGDAPYTELGTTYADDPFVGIVKQFTLPAKWIEQGLLYYVAILAAVILFIATNAAILGVSRVTYSMAQYRQIPNALRAVHPRFLSPWIAIILFSSIGCLMLTPPLFGLVTSDEQNQVLGNLYAFGAMLSFSIAHISLIKMRWRGDETVWRAPFNLKIGKRDLPMFAILGVAGTGAAWMVQVYTHPLERAIGFGWMFIGPLFYVYYRKSQGLPLMSTVRAAVTVAPPSAEVDYRDILVPVLQGRLDQATMVVACKVAAQRGSTIVAAAVIEVPQSLPLTAELGDAEWHANQQLDVARAIGDEYGVDVTTRLIRTRNADTAVLEEALRRESQLIVLGVHPRRHLGSSLVGRTNERVLRRAPVRVLLVRERDDYIMRAGGGMR